MKKMALGVFVLLLGMNVGCGPDETATQTQSLGSGCTLLRPTTWTVRGVTCSEGPGPEPSYAMGDGEVYEAIGIPYSVFGQGYATFLCSNGAISQTYAQCAKFVDP